MTTERRFRTHMSKQNPNEKLHEIRSMWSQAPASLFTSCKALRRRCHSDSPADFAPGIGGNSLGPRGFRPRVSGLQSVSRACSIIDCCQECEALAFRYSLVLCFPSPTGLVFLFVFGFRSRICVKNLPKHATEGRLREFFSQKGEVTDAKIMRTALVWCFSLFSIRGYSVFVGSPKLADFWGWVSSLRSRRDGKSRQFGFVGFRTEKEAAEAVKYFTNTFMDTSKLVCEVGLYFVLVFFLLTSTGFASPSSFMQLAYWFNKSSIYCNSSLADSRYRYISVVSFAVYVSRDLNIRFYLCRFCCFLNFAYCFTANYCWLMYDLLSS